MIEGKIPPHDIDAEQQVLGAMLIDPDSTLNITDIISAGDFYKESHRILFRVCCELYGDGGADLVRVADRLRQIDSLDFVGGGQYLAAIAGATPTSANIKYHGRIIKEKALLRKLASVSSQIGGKAMSGEVEAHTLLAQMERAAVELAESVGTRKSPEIAHILKDVKAWWQRIWDGDSVCVKAPTSISSSIPGAFPGHMWVIGGYTSAGKSTFLAQLIVDFMRHGASRPLIFSTEDSREEKAIKLISNLADVPQKKLLTGAFLDRADEVVEAQQLLEMWDPIIYDDVRTVEEIRLKTKKHKIQDGIDIVALDYVQNLDGTGDLYRDMSHAARSIFKMGKELSVTPIILSQVNNESMREDSQLIGLKGAGELASAADIVLWLKRQQGRGNERNLDAEIRKNRPFGETGVLPMMFTERYTQIIRRD